MPSPNLFAVLSDGTTVTTLRQPRDTFNISARLDHALNKDHSIRLSVDRDNATVHNLGVGG